MLVKRAQSASRGWRKLRGHQHIPDLIKSVNFIDGVNEQTLKEQSSSGSQLDTTHKSSPEKFSLNTTFGSNSMEVNRFKSIFDSIAVKNGWIAAKGGWVHNIKENDECIVSIDLQGSSDFFVADP